MMAFILIIFTAVVILQLFFIIYLWVDRKRWKNLYNEDLSSFNEHISSVKSEYKEELEKERILTIQMTDKLEKNEHLIKGYRSLLSETHNKLSQIVKQDYKTMGRDLRLLIIHLLDFAKQDIIQENVIDSDLKKKAFVKLIMEKYPTITEASAQFAYLISINVPVSEISKIMGINAKSVQMARFRLRKKMELSESDNLVDCLQLIKNESAQQYQFVSNETSALN